MRPLLKNDKSTPELNRVLPDDSPIHDWYRFVLSYPPHLVREYVTKFDLQSGDRILDPFCGTGTTIVEAKNQGLPSSGIEANPMAFLAGTVKTDWSVVPSNLLAEAIVGRVEQELANLPASELEYRPLLDQPRPRRSGVGGLKSETQLSGGSK
jgi:hypothetical protein